MSTNTSVSYHTHAVLTKSTADDRRRTSISANTRALVINSRLELKRTTTAKTSSSSNSSNSSSSSYGNNNDTNTTSNKGEVSLLDYGAGNVRSVRNALQKLGYEVKDIKSAKEVLLAKRLVFPGVGAYGSAMDILRERALIEPLREYVLNGNRPFMGVCLGLQLLFDGSEESGGCEGLGLIPGTVQKFTGNDLIVPHIGWNVNEIMKEDQYLLDVNEKSQRVYFVHSYRALPNAMNKDWVSATCDYGSEPFIAAVQKGNVMATQFHPEKSGFAGLKIFDQFLSKGESDIDLTAWMNNNHNNNNKNKNITESSKKGLAKRVIACLDVRSNDAGDLVVTKGDSYDVREKGKGESGDVRNLGKPVELAKKYFDMGADEVSFLNITGYRDTPLKDAPMIEVLKLASETVFVPLTVGGGIRDFTDSNGKHYSSLEVASAYFASGADKVSIGSDAVEVAEKFYKNKEKGDGTSSIETISNRYGSQAVVISIDPRRKYESDPKNTKNKCIETKRKLGPNGEKYCWFQCTIKGGREGRDIGAYELAIAMEKLGAGEILLNCIDEDGQGNGFDHELVKMVADAVKIPVIASSGAGHPRHFSEVFAAVPACSAALAAGIFHRDEVTVLECKEDMAKNGLPTRI